MNGIKIIFLTPGFPANEADTTCIPLLQDYISALQKIIPPSQIKIIAFQYPFNKKLYSWNGIDVFSAGGKNKKGIHKLFVWFKIIKQFKKFSHRQKNIVIHSFWLTETAFIGNYLAKKYTYPHITSLLGQDAKPENKYLKKINFKLLHIVVPNKRMLEQLKITIPQFSYDIIPFGLKKMVVTPQQRNIDLLFVSSFIALKRPSHFLELVQFICKKNPLVKSVMIGKGPLLEKIKDEIVQMHLEKNIEVTGELPRKKVFEIMQQSKILVHTSEYESQSGVINEALANGMVVSCYDIGRQESSSRIFANKNLNELLLTTENLLHTNLQFLSEQIFNADDMAKKYNTLYETVLNSEKK